MAKSITMNVPTPGAEAQLLLTTVKSFCEPSQSTAISKNLSEVDWELFFHLSRRHDVMPLAADALSRYASEGLNDTLRAKLKKVMYSAMRHDIEYRAWLNETMSILDKSGLHPIVLKGLPLANMIYEKTYLRQSTDIDLLVNPDSLVATGLALVEAGYDLCQHLPCPVDELEGIDLMVLSNGRLPTASAEFTRRYDHHLCFRRSSSADPQIIEVHWKPAPGRVSPLDAARWMQSVSMEIDGIHIRKHKPEQVAVHLLMHILHHGYSEGTLRRMIDLSLVLKQVDAQGWETAKEMLADMRINGLAYFILHWCKDYISAPVPDYILYDLTPAPYHRWLSRPARSFGEAIQLEDIRGIRPKLETFAREMAEVRPILGKGLFLVGVIFPPVEEQAYRLDMPVSAKVYLICWFKPIIAVFGSLARAFRRKLRAPTISGKRHVEDVSTILRVLSRISTMGSSLREKGSVASFFGRMLNSVSARLYDMSMFTSLAVKRLFVTVDLQDIAWTELAGAQVDSMKLHRLTSLVYNSIAYARSTVWLNAEDVIRLGYGDCKCQAGLLNQLFQLAGIEARTVVGMIGQRFGRPTIHAWVETVVEGQHLVCDPTRFDIPVTREEYSRLCGGMLDVTEEYLMDHRIPPSNARTA